MSKHGMAVGLNHSEMSYHILADDVSGEHPVLDCPVVISGSGGKGKYTLIGNMGATTGAIIVKFDPASVPDRCVWTYDGTSASEYSSSSEGYLEGVIGTISSGANCGLTNADGSDGVTFTGNNHYYDQTAGAYESDGTTVDLNSGSAYTASQVTLTTNAPGDCYMVVPKPNSSPTNVTLVIDGPCSGTGWSVDMYCAKALTAKPMGAAGAACSTITNLTGMEVTGGTTLTGSTDISGLNGQYIFGNGIPFGTTITAVNVGGDPNTATISKTSTNASGLDVTASAGILYFVDVNHAEGNTVGSTSYNAAHQPETNDWVFTDENGANQLAAGTYPVEVVVGGAQKKIVVSSDGIITAVNNC